MTAEEKVARHRLSVLELAQVLGNVNEACRRRGMTRTQFYDDKRRVSAARAGGSQRPAAHSQNASADHHARDR